MGTWGTQIYEDDAALDVRDEFMALRAKDISIDEIEASITKDFIEDKYPDGNDVVMLALCCAELETGTLTNATKDKALEIIHSGRQVEFWAAESDESDANDRKQELEWLKSIILAYDDKPVDHPKWSSMQHSSKQTLEYKVSGKKPKGLLAVLNRVAYGVGYMCLFALILYGLYILFGQST